MITPNWLRVGVLGLAVLVTATAQAARNDELAARIERLEKLVQSQGMMEMMSQIQQLQRELRQLRGDLEVQTHNLEQLQQRQRDLYVDIDRRMQQLQGGGGVGMPPSDGGMPGMSGGSGGGMSAAPSPGAADPGAEQAAYDQALNILREGRYPEAAEAYRQFLASYPGSRYADNAQYWLAETHYVTRQFKLGLEEFRKVLDQYPNSPKVADAQLKIGYILYELGDWKAARENLEAVTQRYPESTAARLASERLARMTRERR